MSFTDMMADLIEFCDKHGVKLDSIAQVSNYKEYDIHLFYRVNGHDGCKCHKLDTFTEPDADGEVEIKRGELSVGDRVIYYGIDKENHGREGTIEQLHRGGFTVMVNVGKCIYDDVSISQLRRKVNGA